MGRYLDIARATRQQARAPADGPETLKPCLEARLEHSGIRLAIDRHTGEVCLVFTESDTEAARSVAELYKPFERDWTAEQRRTVLADLEYYERLILKNGRAAISKERKASMSTGQTPCADK